MTPDKDPTYEAKIAIKAAKIPAHLFPFDVLRGSVAPQRVADLERVINVQDIMLDRLFGSVPNSIAKPLGRAAFIVDIHTLVTSWYPITRAGDLWRDVVKVLGAGAKKYEAHGWETKPMRHVDVYGAFFRHWLAIFSGEEIDPEFGLRHEAHALCELMFLSAYETRGLGEPYRPYPVPKPSTPLDVANAVADALQAESDATPAYDIKTHAMPAPTEVRAATPDELRARANKAYRELEGSINALWAGIRCGEALAEPRALDPEQDAERAIEAARAVSPGGPREKITAPGEWPGATSEPRAYLWRVGGGRQFLVPHTIDELPSMAEIAERLNGTRRFNGLGCSVSRHSVLTSLIVAKMLPDDYTVQMAALLHDAHECLYGDVNQPLKKDLRSTRYAELCDNFDKLLFEREGLPLSALARQVIAEADTIATALEAHYILDVPWVWVADHLELTHKAVTPELTGLFDASYNTSFMRRCYDLRAKYGSVPATETTAGQSRG